jgi:hypothetical protein
MLEIAATTYMVTVHFVLNNRFVLCTSILLLHLIHITCRYSVYIHTVLNIKPSPFHQFGLLK